MSEAAASTDPAKMSAYQRWELAAFDAELPAGARGLGTVDELEQLHQRARDEGFRAGREEGRVQAAAEAARLAALASACAREIARIEERLAEQVLDVALEVARQVLRESLRVRPELLLPAVREALSALPAAAQAARLHVHPEDAALVRAELGERHANLGVRLVEDATVVRGGCLLRGETGDVDATLDIRWARVQATLGRSSDWLEG